MQDHIYLAHHGIKGMKWGVRRYQNPDGTLTEAGKKRQYKQDMRQIKREHKQARKSGQIKDVTNRQKVLSKVMTEATSTDEYKTFDTYGKNLQAITKKLAEQNGVRPDQIVFTKDVVDRHEEYRQKACKRGREIAESYMDDMVTATISDLRATDTEAARDYVKRQLVREGYYRYFD